MTAHHINTILIYKIGDRKKIIENIWIFITKRFCEINKNIVNRRQEQKYGGADVYNDDKEKKDELQSELDEDKYND